MTTIQKTDRLLEQLEVLTPEEVDLVIAFVEFLHYKKITQSQTQARSSLNRKNLARLRGIAKPGSGVEPGDPLSDYVDYLTDKYQ